MSEWKDRKNQFYRHMVTNGVSTFEDLHRLYPLGWDVPTQKLDRWFTKFFEYMPPKGMPPTLRVINHFRMGADPEFIFVDPTLGARRDASQFKMRAGQAFGADNNGRLAEIRPFAEKSALLVLASTLSTLRWLAITVPNTRGYEWKCGAFLQQDGLGGHIHFGRKQQHLRKREVAGLDLLSMELEGLNVYPLTEVALRKRGDQFHQVYGMPGDVREQPYGYEYRTFPSWLDSPWMAFFHLVLSKVAVHDPELFNAKAFDKRHIENLLHYYKYLDDDVHLASWTYKRFGIPTHKGGNFQVRWGITGYRDMELVPKVDIIPGAIPPDEETVQELWDYFTLGTPLKTGYIPKVSWAPSKVPDGFFMLLDYNDTRGMKGLGEMIWDICTGKGMEKGLTIGCQKGEFRDGALIQVSHDAERVLHPEWRRLTKGKVLLADGGFDVTLSSTGRGKEAKEILLSGAFPFWQVGEVTGKKLQDYMDMLKNRKHIRKPAQKFIGRHEVYA